MRDTSTSPLLNLEMLRRPPESKHYTSIAFGLRCKEVGVRPSTGTVADCYDNTMSESFFATLECELLEKKPFQTQAQARMAVYDFSEGWYNPHKNIAPINTVLSIRLLPDPMGPTAHVKVRRTATGYRS